MDCGIILAMKNLDEPLPNGAPTPDGEAYDPEDDLPASPEEIGYTRRPTEGVDAPIEKTEPEDTSAADESGPEELVSDAVSDEPPEIGEQDEGDLPSPEEISGSVDTPQPIGKKKRGRSRWLLITILGLFLLLLIAFISAFGGYRSGIALRQSAESTQVAAVIKQQYELGSQDLEEGNYYRAKQRLEYVLSLDPLYPEAADKLSAALFELSTTATPTPVPTPTLTPTPDTRADQEIFNQAQEYLRNSEWDNTIDTLLTLRKSNPDFMAVQVDGMLFIALRNRGRDKILLQQDLEGGIYDLTLAKRFGVLDAEAEGLLNWTQLYITGASFWEIDWGQAAFYFGQVAPNLPNLMDKSGLTAGERYRQSLIEYGYYLADQKMWCKSYEQFEIALSIAYDAQVEKDMNTAAERCAKAQETPSK